MITCKFEDGNDASLRHIVVHILVVKDEKILMVKRAPHLIEGGKWGFPGGFVDRDESLSQAVLRELKEETGYEGKVKAIFRINSNPNRKNDAGRQNIAHEYLVEAGEKTGEPDHEQTAVEWRVLDELEEDELAFDQFETLGLLKQYLNKEIELPIIPL